jgi:hypothetical protein
VEACEGDDTLPLVYDPAQIAAFWARRPVAVFMRITQLLGIAGGFLSGFLLDLAAGKLAENEVLVLHMCNVPSCNGMHELHICSSSQVTCTGCRPCSQARMQRHR